MASAGARVGLIRFGAAGRELVVTVFEQLAGARLALQPDSRSAPFREPPS